MKLHAKDRLEAPEVQMLQLLTGEDADNQSVFLHCSNFTHFDFWQLINLLNQKVLLMWNLT